MSEKISSLVDGEASFNQSDIDNIKNNSEAAKKWTNYHLISSVIKETVPAALPKDFSKSVMHAIEQEPVVLSPKTSRVKKPWLRTVSGLAVAATVAAVTVSGLQTVWQPTDNAPGQTPLAQNEVVPAEERSLIDLLDKEPAITVKNTATASVGAGITVLPVNVLTTTNDAFSDNFSSDLRWKRSAPSASLEEQEANKLMAEKLNSMLMNHVRSTGTLHGMMPYARLAGYDD